METIEGREVNDRSFSRWRGLRARPMVVLSAMVLAALVLAALCAPLLAPFDPDRGDFTAVFQSPSRQHWLGTDGTGRDVLSRVLFGARTSMVAASIAVATSVGLGVPFGLVAGYSRGIAGAVLERIFDAIQSVPPLILALALVAVLGPGLGYAMFAVGLVYAPRCYRVTRAATLELRQTTFVEAENALGMSTSRILGIHVLLNVMSPLIVVVAVSFGTGILAEASLSFLGLGAQIPTASWGQMLQTAFQRSDLTYLAIPPGVCVLLSVGAFVILGDTLRERIVGGAK